MWDLALDPARGDLTGGIVTGQDEILQRIMVRLHRLFGEWFCNRTAGMPWYEGESELLSGQASPAQAILGSRDIGYANVRIRAEIADTKGVIQIVEFKAHLDRNTREYMVDAKVATDYGLASIRFNTQV